MSASAYPYSFINHGSLNNQNGRSLVNKSCDSNSPSRTQINYDLYIFDFGSDSNPK